MDGYRKPANNAPGFRPQRPVMLNNPKRPGSVTGSIEGRLASNPSSGGRRGQAQFMATSSPLPEVSAEEELDLWDAASLDYPGRQSPGEGNGWEFMEDEEDDPRFYDEPRYHSWHFWILHLTWVLAIGMGIPAAMFVEYQPFVPEGVRGVRPGSPSRPGCFIQADPFKNPYSTTVNDPGFNYTLSFLIICFLITVVVMFIMIMLVCFHKTTKSDKFRRYVKILSLCFVVFVVSRAPLDFIQLKGLIEAAMGFKQLNIRAYELEYEILLMWTTYIPLFAHPIIYFSFCSEYRQGGLKTLRTMCGCQEAAERKEEEKLSKYREDEILENRSTVSKTQVSNML